MSEKCIHKGKEPAAAEKAVEKAEKVRAKRVRRKERIREEKAALRDEEEAKKTAEAGSGSNKQQTTSSEASETDSPVKLGPLAARRLRVGLGEEHFAWKALYNLNNEL